MLHHLSGCIQSWGCFNCMTQNIKTQKSFGSLLLGWGLEDSRRPVAFPSPCVPFPCVCICIGKLECYHLAGKSRGTLLPGWMAQTIQCSTGRTLASPAELHMGLETFPRSVWGLLWKLDLLVSLLGFCLKPELDAVLRGAKTEVSLNSSFRKYN